MSCRAQDWRLPVIPLRHITWAGLFTVRLPCVSFFILLDLA